MHRLLSVSTLRVVSGVSAAAALFICGNLLTALMLHATDWAQALAWLAGAVWVLGGVAELAVYLRVRKAQAVSPPRHRRVALTTEESRS